MGARFRKSIDIGGGAKINLSAKGIGASIGTKGIRVGKGTRGERVTTSIPGTGIYSTQVAGEKHNLKYDKDLGRYEIPDGVKIPSTPKKIDISLILTFALLAISFATVVTLPIAIACLALTIYWMLTNKEFKCAHKMQKAIKAYEVGDFEYSKFLCEKSQKYKDNESAKILIDEIQHLN